MSLFDRLGQGISNAVNDPNFNDRLILGLSGLTMNPNQAAIQYAQGNIQQRRQDDLLKRQSNATIDFLKRSGVKPEILAQAENNPAILQELLKRVMAKPKAAPSSVQEYEYAKKQGFDGTFEEWTMKKAQLQGGGKLTEGEGKSTGFFGRMLASNDVINKFEQEGLNLGQTLAGGVPLVGNFMVSENYQQLKNAQEDFLKAILRKESGATITDEEMASYGPIYFPQPGDSQQVIEQKRRNRERQVEAMKFTAGKGASQLEQMQNQGGLNQGITRVEG